MIALSPIQLQKLAEYVATEAPDTESVVIERYHHLTGQLNDHVRVDLVGVNESLIEEVVVYDDGRVLEPTS